MGNVIILAILLVMVVLAVNSGRKHFKGSGGCCGGGGYKVKKKHLPNVIFTRKFTVDGMHCENCKQRVEEIVNDISDVSGSVDLKKKELTVSYAKDVDNSIIIQRIEKAGYKVTAQD